MKRALTVFCAAATCAAVLVGCGSAVQPTTGHAVDRYNVVWDTPSLNTAGSMPLGNGDIGMNVWVEPSGDLVFYISKTDAWSEVCRLLKLGRVRVKLTPNPLADSTAFLQTLHLGQGRIEIVLGAGDDRVVLNLWADANNPVIRLEAHSVKPVQVQAQLEVWRDGKKPPFHPLDGFSMFGLIGPAEESPDVVLPARGERILWYHRNERSAWPLTLKNQKMEDYAREHRDPLLDRTFGALMSGEGFAARDDRTLVSPPRQSHLLSIYPLTAQTATPEQYVRELEGMATRVGAAAMERQRREHFDWWRQFWNRSYIRVRLPEQDLPAHKAITPTDQPLTFGAAPDGSMRFDGEIADVRLWGRALNDREIVARAEGKEITDSAGLLARWSFEPRRDGVFANHVGGGLDARVVGTVHAGKGPSGLPTLRLDGRGYVQVPHDDRLNLADRMTLEFRVMPARTTPARIIDKTVAGTADGYGLDFHPEGTLRTIIQPGLLHAPNALTAGQWSHVTLVFDREAGRHGLFVNGRRVAGAELPRADRDYLARAYALQRFISACAGRGAYPIKFNGSLFTFDMPETWGAPKGAKDWPADADYRRWGGGYWFQNTRLPYWPMLASGDHDLMQPFLDMYLRALEFGRYRTRLYYNHPGAMFPETMFFWGSYHNGDSRLPDPGKITNVWIRYYFSANTEFLAMMLDYFRFTQDERFLKEKLLPAAADVLAFYEHRYGQGDHAPLRLYPSAALETWQDALNPANELAGLHWVVDGLLGLDARLTTPAQREHWKKYKAKLPPLPIKQDSQGRRFIAPAQEVYEPVRNAENPELYAVFPFRLYGLGKDDLTMARLTYAKRLNKGGAGWAQNDTFAAYLGLTSEAARYVTTRARPTPDFRFPGFWGPNVDWVPDQDHGGNLLMGLQTMLMQCEGRRILLLGAWPREWDVEFKLHAPLNTTVEGVYRDGKLQRLDVHPAWRKKDVEVMPVQPQARPPLKVPDPKVAPERLAKAFQVDLSAFANRALADEVEDDGKGGWSDQGSHCDMRRMPTGTLMLGKVPFRVLEGPKAAVVLKSSSRPQSADLPEKVTIPVNRRAEALFFLHSGAWLTGPDNFRYVIRYSDGKAVTLTVGEHNILDWVDPDPLSRFPAEKDTVSTVAMTVPVPKYGQGSVYRMEWVAPPDRAGVEITGIEFAGDGKTVPILLAITGVGD